MSRFSFLHGMVFFVLASTMVCVAFADMPVTNRYESFASSPSGWVGYNNQSVPHGTSYGFSNTANAGGTAGEAGGELPERVNDITYYADTDFSSALSQNGGATLTASGRFKLTTTWGDGGLRLGWFDKSTTPGYNDYVGLTIAGGGATGWGPQVIMNQYALAYGPPGGFGAQTLSVGTEYLFSMTYDPTGTDATHGSLNVELRLASNNSLVASVTTSNIVSGAGDYTATLDAFGLLSNYSGSTIPGPFTIFIDDLSYSTPYVSPLTRYEDFATNPSRWVGYNNYSVPFGTSYGFSNTANAGGTAGEAGGGLPERVNDITYYGDTDFAGALSQKGTTLRAAGLFKLTASRGDGGIKLGWFDKSTTPGYNDFVGMGVAGQSSTTGWGPQVIMNQYGHYYGPPGGFGAHSLAVGTAYLFSMTYDPTGTDATHGSLTVELRLAGNNSLLESITTTGIVSGAGDYTATLDAFGLLSNYSGSIIHGPYTVFIDDLSYTGYPVAPVPVPATLLLLALGLPGWIVRARRKAS